MQDGDGNFVTRTRVGTKIRSVRARRALGSKLEPSTPGLFPQGPRPAPTFGKQAAGFLGVAQAQQRLKHGDDGREAPKASPKRRG